ncbi:helix-hairpin-helix domain-containing protein [Caloranaerobacter ferrireducens]|uniref:helix-hairpin-helix domain-containing protein n=1 Tax=Caloranaerobacter ferrireducens TaxID=1323370 RepID=UPI00084DA0E3|nr:helix-hairpin-helix domain-containing protein [Caloranaerobacter ferrireducens]
MVSFTKKEQIVILILVVCIISVVSIKLIRSNEIKIDEVGQDINNIEDTENVNTSEKNIEEENIDKTIMVHISGEVYRPGLVILKEGDRVIDAVNAAGGLKEEADLDRINLAKKLVDEEKIYIPKKGEESFTSNSQENVVASTNVSTSKIDINNASLNELMDLPGIGKVLAGRIIEYRTKNRFNDIEEIKNVSGIGEKKFEAIRDLITVN